MVGRLARRRELLAFLFLALALGFLQQGPGFEQTSHYALVRALAHGTATIEDEFPHLGELATRDVILRDGHVYSNKAPGLALASVPTFFVAKAAGVPTSGDPTLMLWALGLWSVALVSLVLALLVRERAQRVAPGTGTAVAVTLGLGTLILPFSGLFFSHPLSALLGFAAFVLLWRERESAQRLALVAAGGLLAGLAVTTEYPNGVAACVLAVYACARTDRLRRGLVYLAGVALGVLPLALYNTFAFGSPFRLSYRALPPASPGLSPTEPGEGGGFRGGDLGRGIFGIDVPRPSATLDVLFSAQGLFPAAPVLLASLVGLVLLFRTRRAETLVIAALVLGYVAWVSGFVSPLSGLLPGPRYLIFLLPFLAVGLAPAFRAFPLPTLALAAVSVANMVMISATGTHPAFDGQWVERAAARTFKPTALAAIGITGWYTIIVFFGACLAAAAFAAATLRPVRLGARQLAVTALALAAWGALALAAPSEHGRFERGYVLVVALFGLGCAVAAAVRPRLGPAPPEPALGTGAR